MKDLDQHLGKLFTDEEIQEMLDAANKAMSNAFNNATAPSVPNASSAGSTTGSTGVWASAATVLPHCVTWVKQHGQGVANYSWLTSSEYAEVVQQLTKYASYLTTQEVADVADYISNVNRKTHNICMVGSYVVPKIPVVSAIPQSPYGTGAPGNLNVGNPGGGGGAGGGVGGVNWYPVNVLGVQSVKEVRFPDIDMDKTPITKKIDKDWCVKCNRRAEFVRMSLVCPQCKSQLGGC